MLLKVRSVLPPELDRLVHLIIGCAIAVHKALGPGLVEGIYQDAMVIELGAAGLKYEAELAVQLTYRGKPLRAQRIDLVVEQQVIVELKSVERLERIHQSQLIAYLKATSLKVGLLINFNSDYLKGQIRRIVV
jgi:GxxExxY protein